MHNPMANKTAEERSAIAKKGHETQRKRREEEDRREEEARQHAINLKFSIQSLSEKLDSLQKLELSSKTAMTLTGKTLLSEEEIVKTATPYVEATGVYFLVKYPKVVYVGQSTNIYSRMQNHKHGKDFDAFAYIPCKRELLDKLESLYIHLLRPKLNGEVGGVKVAPLTLEELFK